MTEADARGGPGPAAWLDPAILNDWITIWHSELAAAVVDREAQEALLRLLDQWAAQARQVVAAFGPAHERVAGPVPAAGAAPTAAAPAGPDGRDAVIAGLLARVAELERRLDGG